MSPKRRPLLSLALAFFSSLSLHAASTTYSGTPMAVPGTILTAQYDNGGEGVAYHDVDASNLASSTYRPGNGVDSNGTGVGWIVASEWLAYTVNVSAAGNYKLSIPVSQTAAGATMHVSFNGSNLTGAMAIPNTGNWDTYQNITATVTLNAGTQIMQVAFDLNASNGYGPGLKDIAVSAAGGNNPPSVAMTAPANGATFAAPANITLSATASDSDGTVSKVDFYQGATLLGTDTTSPYSFVWNSVVAGSYSLTARATDNSGAVTTSNAVSITASYQTPFNGILMPMAIPGTVPIGNYDNGGEGVAYHDTDASNNASSTFRPGLGVDADGTRIGWIQPTEWVEYTVKVATAGTYNLAMAVANPANGGSFHISFDGVNKTGAISVPNTGNWDVYQTINVPATLSAGTQIMQVAFDTTTSAGAVLNLKDIVFTTGGGNAAPSVTMTGPTNGQTFTAPANITLSANASDSDGTVSKVEFYQGATLIGTDTTSPYSVAWNSVAAGSYALTAKATDNANATTTSSVVNITVAAGSSQTPYNGSPFAVPGTIATAQYDNGGEGVAFHDTDNVNQQSSTYRPGLGVDSSGSGIGWVYASEWLEYTVNVGTSGAYTLTIPVCHQGTGGTMHVSFNGVNVTGALSVPNTGSWSTFQNIVKTVTLNSGVQVMQVMFDTADSAGYGPGLGDITISGGGNTAPSVALTSPTNGQSFTAPANITLSATASDSDGTVSKVDFYQGTNLIGTDTTSPYSVAWNSVAAGSYSLTAKATDNANAITTSSVVSITVNAVIGQTPYSGTPAVIPGTITIGNYDNGGEAVAYHDVDAANRQSSTFRPGLGVDADNTHIGWIQPGEWVEYTVNVTTAGAYNLAMGVANPANGGSFHISFDGVNKTGAITVPNTGNWDVYQTINVPATLSAGTQVMQVAFDTTTSAGAVLNLQDIIFTTAGGGTTNPQPPATPTVTLDILGGLQQATIDGANTYLTNSTQVTVRVAAQTTLGTISSLDVMSSDGQDKPFSGSSSYEQQTVSFTLTEGLWQFNASASASNDGLNASADSQSIRVLVDTTPPVLVCRPASKYWQNQSVPEVLPGIATNAADQRIVYLNGNPDDIDNSMLRKTRNTFTYDRATFSVVAEVIDASGLESAGPANAHFLFSGSTPEPITINLTGQFPSQTVTISGFSGVTESTAVKAIQTTLKDRCGNTVTADQFMVLCDVTPDNLPTASAPGGYHVGDVPPFRIVGPTRFGWWTTESWQDTIGKGNRILSSLLPRSKQFVDSFDPNSYITIVTRDAAGNKGGRTIIDPIWFPFYITEYSNNPTIDTEFTQIGSAGPGLFLVSRDSDPAGYRQDTFVSQTVFPKIKVSSLPQEGIQWLRYFRAEFTLDQFGHSTCKVYFGTPPDNAAPGNDVILPATNVKPIYTPRQSASSIPANYVALSVSPVDPGPDSDLRRSTPVVITLPPSWKKDETTTVRMRVQDNGTKQVRAGMYDHSTISLGTVSAGGQVGSGASDLIADIPIKHDSTSLPPGTTSVNYSAGGESSVTYMNWYSNRWATVVRLDPDIVTSGNRMTVNIDAGFVDENFAIEDFSNVGDYVHFIDSTSNTDITQTASQWNPTADPALRAGKIAIVAQRFLVDGPRQGVQQTLQLDIEVGPNVAAQLYHLDIKLGAVHAYSDSLSQLTAGANGTHRMKQALKVLKVDLDVDSDNNDALAPPQRTAAEEAVELYSNDPTHAGKVMFTNNGDHDGDGIVDYADGYGFSRGAMSDATSAGVKFVPVVLELPNDLPAAAKVKLTYSASDPLDLQQSSQDPFILPAGSLRLWLKDGDAQRNGKPVKGQGGDYIASDTYSPSDLGFSAQSTTKTFYLEAVRPIQKTGSLTIQVDVDFNGTGQFTAGDVVNIHPVAWSIQGRAYQDAIYSPRDRLVATQMTETGDSSSGGITIGFAHLEINTQQAGSTQTETTGAILVRGAGVGLQGTADGLALYATSQADQFDLRGRIGSLSGPASARAGLIVRSGSASNASFVAISQTGTATAVLYRTQNGGSLQTTTLGGVTAGQWFRLYREGGSVRCFTSTQALPTTWTEVASVQIDLVGSALAGLFTSSGAATVLADARFTDVSLSLSSFPLNAGNDTRPLTPGAYLVQQIRILDPRDLPNPQVSINSKSLALTRVNGILTSEPYWTADESPYGASAFAGYPVIVVSGSAQIAYNPPGATDILKFEPRTDADKAVAEAIEDVVTKMEKSGWTNATDGLPASDAGAYGKGVHSRVAAKFSGKAGWLAEIYVDNITLEIKPGPLPPGQPGRTNVDLMKLKPGYKPQVGDILDRTKIEEIYEIKTSIQGKVEPDQLRRLKDIKGGQIQVARVSKRWTIAKSWHPNPRYGRGAKILALFGLASSAYSVLNASDHDDQLDEAIDAGVAIRDGLNNNIYLFGKDDLEYKQDCMAFNEKCFAYIGNFTGGTATDLVKLVMCYKIIGDKEYDPHYGE